MSDPTIAEQVLELWGATPQPLPTSTEQESDWLAVLDGCRLLIEEKTKLDNPDAAAARNQTLRSGSAYGWTSPLVYNNRLSGIVGKAAKQLESTGSRLDHDLRVVWFTGVGHDAEAKQMQFIATLYGSANVFSPGSRMRLVPCYFFRNSDFFRYRGYLDGAIAAYLAGNNVTMKLCLNPYSDKWKALRDSPFAKQFPKGLVDPSAEEAAGHAYIADTDINRANPDQVLGYIQEKYKTGPLRTMDLNIASAEVVIRPPPQNQQ